MPFSRRSLRAVDLFRSKSTEQECPLTVKLMPGDRFLVNANGRRPACVSQARAGGPFSCQSQRTVARFIVEPNGHQFVFTPKACVGGVFPSKPMACGTLECRIHGALRRFHVETNNRQANFTLKLTVIGPLSRRGRGPAGCSHIQANLLWAAFASKFRAGWPFPRRKGLAVYVRFMLKSTNGYFPQFEAIAKELFHLRHSFNRITHRF